MKNLTLTLESAEHKLWKQLAVNTDTSLKELVRYAMANTYFTTGEYKGKSYNQILVDAGKFAIEDKQDN
jgi:hypothetical protein